MFGPLHKIAICSVALAIVALSVTVFPQERKASAAIENFATPWTVSVTPSTSLLDGQLITVNVKTDVDHPMTVVQAQVCRSGVQYMPSSGSDPATDFSLGGANCPSIPVSTSGDIRIADDGPATYGTTDAGYSFQMYVGVGTVNWSGSDGDQTMTCDETTPCSLVVETRGKDEAGDYRWIPYVHELTYQVTDPISGCGGKATDFLATASSDRMIDSWVRWALEQCHLPGAQTGAATVQSFAEESLAMESFSLGTADIAYSAVGYDSKVGFGQGTTAEPIAMRDYVAVPVALNAMVLAVGNGVPSGGRKVPYANVRMTVDEVTHLLAGGGSGLMGDLSAIVERNPQFLLNGLFAPASQISLGANAENEATSWLFTNHFDVVRPELWKVPDDNAFGPERGMDRGSYSRLPTADPSFGGVFDLFTGRTTLDKAIKKLTKNDYGGVWAITDAASANALAMTPVQIAYDGASVNFVGPTQAAMNAAVSTMTSTTDGRLLPDPTKFVDSSGPEVDGQLAYPMTYVEYAIVPKAPLVDKACAPRSGSQALMTNWLKYVVNEGQSNLPSGLQPLTDDLKAAATAAIAQVGTGTVTCTPPAALSNSGAGSQTVVPPSAPGVVSRTATKSGTAASATSVAAGAAANTQVLADAELASALADMGSFNDGSATSGLLAIGGLVAVFGLLVVSAMATSGKLNLRGRSGK